MMCRICALPATAGFGFPVRPTRASAMDASMMACGSFSFSARSAQSFAGWRSMATRAA